MASFDNPKEVWQPFGTFSMVAIQGQGQIVHLKGQVALDEHAVVVGKNDMLTQVDKTLQNIQLVLKSLGGRMADIYSLVQHVTDIEAFMQAGHVREKYFQAPYPITTTVEISRLYHPDLLVEITCSVEIPHERFRQPDPRNA